MSSIVMEPFSTSAFKVKSALKATPFELTFKLRRYLHAFLLVRGVITSSNDRASTTHLAPSIFRAMGVWRLIPVFGSTHIASSAYQKWPTKSLYFSPPEGGLLSSPTKRPNSILTRSEFENQLRMKLDLRGSSYPEGNFGRNQLLGDKRFARQHCGKPPPEFPLASPSSSIVHHLSGPILCALPRILFEQSQNDPGRLYRRPPKRRSFSRFSLSIRVGVLITLTLAHKTASLIRVSRRDVQKTHSNVEAAAPLEPPQPTKLTQQNCTQGRSFKYKQCQAPSQIKDR
eukprot:gene2362-2916_t